MRITDNFLRRLEELRLWAIDQNKRAGYADAGKPIAELPAKATMGMWDDFCAVY